MAEKEYRRLTRTRARVAFGIVSTGRSSLWLGKDHLLATSFHPELTGDTRVHEYFVEMVREQA